MSVEVAESLRPSNTSVLSVASLEHVFEFGRHAEDFGTLRHRQPTRSGPLSILVQLSVPGSHSSALPKIFEVGDHTLGRRVDGEGTFNGGHDRRIPRGTGI